MISFAQNHEDVLLARALTDTESGFYIDVGAYDPEQDSVTRHFYDLGWHGINIEPQPAYAAKLRAARPRDVTLAVALSDHRGYAALYNVSLGDGVATINEAQVDRLRAQTQVVAETRVEVTTLADVCAEHCDARTPISFLKVDVEGHEREVLTGADWTRWQPRIVVVEATAPLTTEPSHQPWEHILLGSGYELAQFDGINRWYTRYDERRLNELLRVPVNVLDGYVPYVWSARVADLEARVASLTSQLDDATNSPPPSEHLMRSLESLRERYQDLRAALEQERTRALIESERIAELTASVQRLRRGAAD